MAASKPLKGPSGSGGLTLTNQYFRDVPLLSADEEGLAPKEPPMPGLAQVTLKASELFAARSCLVTPDLLRTRAVVPRRLQNKFGAWPPMHGGSGKLDFPAENLIFPTSTHPAYSSARGFGSLPQPVMARFCGDGLRPPPQNLTMTGWGSSPHSKGPTTPTPTPTPRPRPNIKGKSSFRQENQVFHCRHASVAKLQTCFAGVWGPQLACATSPVSPNSF